MNPDLEKIHLVTIEDVQTVREFVDTLAEHFKSDIQRFKIQLFIALVASHCMGRATWNEVVGQALLQWVKDNPVETIGE